jgi:tetratricopeptide (TPR) repeat protein
MDKKNFLAYYGRGKLFLQKGDYDKAIRDETKALQINPSSGLAYLQRSLAWKNKGRDDRHAADFNQATKFDQRAVYAYIAKHTKEQAAISN